MKARLRYLLASATVLHALIFGWATSTLPWRSGTSFGAVLLTLTLLHLATAVAALAGRPTPLLWIWRALSVASGVAFLVFTWSVIAAALYVSALYTRLGPPVAAGILIAGLLLALLTLPMALWGGLSTWPSITTRLRRRLGIGSSLLAAVAVLTLPAVGRQARGEPIVGSDAELISDVRDVLDSHSRRDAEGERLTVASDKAASCPDPVSADTPTVLVSLVSRDGEQRAECLQGSPTQLRIKLRRLLKREARAGSTVVVDVLQVVKPLRSWLPLVDALELRPGVDGVCEEGKCLAAWQLTLGDFFAEERPLAAVPDASFGFSPERVRRALGTAADRKSIDGLIRVEADTLVADGQGVRRLVRTRPTPPALSAFSANEAVTMAERHIIAAQKRDGTFRYALDPSSGKADQATLNLPRQAGTTYALCELGSDQKLKRAVRLALAVFARTETDLGEVSALSNDSGGFGLGRSALPLIAMLRCRELAGTENDRLIGQLSRLLLRLQRDDGSFFPALDPVTRRGSGDHELLYAAGQAVLALVLLEQQLPALKGSAAEPLPSAQSLHRALDHAMDHYGGAYWPSPLRDFFFFEEGWHCLAARSALDSHRHDAYERLCLDYVASRARFILRAADTDEPSFVGGYGVSDLFPPRNTPTAGLGEALSAAISIKAQRGMDVREDKDMLRDLLTFLVGAQWSESSCYACREPALVAGGFSEQLASPSIRIDYVQHAMAAIGHGARLLGLHQPSG